MTDMHKQTRDIYHKQHTRIINDETTIQRIRNYILKSILCWKKTGSKERAPLMQVAEI